MLDGRRSGDGQDHFRTLEQPCQGDLQRSCIETGCNSLDSVMRLFRLTEWSPRKESDVVLLAVIDDEIGFAVGEAIAVLHGDDGHDPAGSLDVFASHIGERYMANFSLLAQLGQGLY